MDAETDTNTNKNKNKNFVANNNETKKNRHFFKNQFS